MRYLSDEWLSEDDPADHLDYFDPHKLSYLDLIDDCEDIGPGTDIDDLVFLGD